MKHLVFVFLDGVGLGPPGPTNPFSTSPYEALRRLAQDQDWTARLQKRKTTTHLTCALDATLGIGGLPQSGTGQASLLTGINCAEIVGRHFGPFPHSKTHPALDEHNLFRRVQTLYPSHSAPSAFANAFPPQFFRATRRRATVTTYCCQAANVEIRDEAAVREGRALPADVTGSTWRTQLQIDVPLHAPSDAARVLASISRRHAFTLFEYFLTDKVGHGRIDWPADELLTTLDEFLGALMAHVDPTRTTLLITSDHGNLEDTSHGQHTRNEVPLIVAGWAAPHFEQAVDLTDVTPGIIRALRSAS